MPPEFKVGDQVAIDLPGLESANPCKGDVVAVLDLPGWMFKNYVVAIETGMDPLLEVRSGNRIWLWDAAAAQV